LKQSQLAYSENEDFPFPIIADPALQVFKEYRAYDDFEGKPLHGTFLIDGAGRILWQDIAAEPFSNPGFLLDEAKRLLEIHSGRPAAKLE
jgi:alkyl hydroperoxide reductase subunit AhpC